MSILNYRQTIQEGKGMDSNSLQSSYEIALKQSFNIQQPSEEILSEIKINDQIQESGDNFGDILIDTGINERINDNQIKRDKSELIQNYRQIDANLRDNDTGLREKLRKQLQFYLGDSNLLKDSFLRDLLRKSKKGKIDLNVFLNFNKIKKYFADYIYQDQKLQLSELRESVKNSSLLRLNKNQSHISRIVPFQSSEELVNDIDDRTIYVENLHELITQENIYNIFKIDSGYIVSVSMPSRLIKTNQDSNLTSKIDFQGQKLVITANLTEILKNSTHQKVTQKINRGYCFIQFDSKQSAVKAKEKFNSLVPMSLMELQLGQLKALIVLSQRDWLQSKQDYQNLKQELVQTRLRKCQIDEEEKQDQENQPYQGKIVKLSSIPKELEQQMVQIYLKKYHIIPEYVDLKSPSDNCYIRFQNQSDSQYLYDCLNSDQGIFFGSVKVNGKIIDGEEEKAYLKVIQEDQIQMRDNFIKQKKVKQE